ncbi:MAG: hypothetical protein ACO3A2_03490 [Bdellovibrionia bacterium]
MHTPDHRLKTFITLFAGLTLGGPAFGFPKEEQIHPRGPLANLNQEETTPSLTSDSSSYKKKQKLDLEIDLYAEEDSLELPSPSRVLDFVFDLDETLVFPIGSPLPLDEFRAIFPIHKFNQLIFDPERRTDSIHLQIGQRVLTHTLAPGALEVLATLSQLKGARLNFFSAGLHLRNLRLLQVLIPEVEKLSHKSIAYEVLSSEDVGPQGEKDLLKFLRFKARSDLSLHSSVLIDDNWAAIHPGQFNNFLRIHSAFSLTSTPQQIQRNLIRILGIIIEAIEEADQSPNSLTLIEAIQRVQTLTEDHPTVEALEEKHFRIGLEAIQEINPNFSS